MRVNIPWAAIETASYYRGSPISEMFHVPWPVMFASTPTPAPRLDALNYSQVVQTIRQGAAELAPKLRNPACQPIFLLHPQPTTKVCLFFHGFTAAPYQFAPLAQMLFKAGYNVLVPLLPGHGLAGDWGPMNPPPLPTKAEPYETFAQAWLQRARGLGQQIVIGGWSGGGTLAAWLGLENSRAIHKTLLFAPYFSSSNRIVDQFTRLVNRYQEWLRPKQGFVPPGYGGFQVPALRVFLEMGRDVLRRSQHEDAPSMFIISSASDRAVSDMDHRLFFDRVLRYQPYAWYLCFDRVQDIPHTMLTQEEGNSHVFLLTRLAKGYIESDLTWAEIADIGQRMARGQVFPAAVADLGLQGRVSPDMPTVMTMIDKRQFLERR